MLKGNPGAAFGPDAYPVESIRRFEQGRVVASLDVDASGTPDKCHVLESSGYQRLDDATCHIALNRLRYEPARNEQGVPIRAVTKLPVRWVLPE